MCKGCLRGSPDGRASAMSVVDLSEPSVSLTRITWCRCVWLGQCSVFAWHMLVIFGHQIQYGKGPAAEWVRRCFSEAFADSNRTWRFDSSLVRFLLLHIMVPNCRALLRSFSIFSSPWVVSRDLARIRKRVSSELRAKRALVAGPFPSLTQGVKCEGVFLSCNSINTQSVAQDLAL